MSHPVATPAVTAVFDNLAPPVRAHLLILRALIFDIAATLPVGRIEESLKWGQPSYTTPDTKSATPIRLGVTKGGDVAIFTHCQSSVMSDFRALAPPDMRFDGNRALHLSPDQPVPADAVAPLIRAALTYRL